MGEQFVAALQASSGISVALMSWQSQRRSVSGNSIHSLNDTVAEGTHRSIKMARWGVSVRLLMGLGLTYGDMTTDAMVTMQLFDRNAVGLGVASCCFIADSSCNMDADAYSRMLMPTQFGFFPSHGSNGRRIALRLSIAIFVACYFTDRVVAVTMFLAFSQWWMVLLLMAAECLVFHVIRIVHKSWWFYLIPIPSRRCRPTQTALMLGHSLCNTVMYLITSTIPHTALMLPALAMPHVCTCWIMYTLCCGVAIVVHVDTHRSHIPTYGVVISSCCVLHQLC